MPQLKRNTKSLRPTYKRVDLPGLGDDYYTYIRRIPASAIRTHGVLLNGANEEQNEKKMAALCVLGTCDAKGIPVFRESDIPELCEWPIGTLIHLTNAIADYNGLTDEPAKNLRKTQRGVSRSG